MQRQMKKQQKYSRLKKQDAPYRSGPLRTWKRSQTSKVRDRRLCGSKRFVMDRGAKIKWLDAPRIANAIDGRRDFCTATKMSYQ